MAWQGDWCGIFIWHLAVNSKFCEGKFWVGASFSSVLWSYATDFWLCKFEWKGSSSVWSGWRGAISISWSSLSIRWIGSCSVNGYVMMEARGRLNCRSTGVWKGAILKVSLTLLDGIVSSAALETLENVAADLINIYVRSSCTGGKLDVQGKSQKSQPRRNSRCLNPQYPLWISASRQNIMSTKT